jgi:RNA polymerase sigma-70 factor (ECF subfamily)
MADRDDENARAANLVLTIRNATLDESERDQAWRVLHAMYWPRIFSLMKRLCARCQGNIRGEAEDLAQDAFLKAVKRLHTFDATLSFGAWLYRVAGNTFLDRRKYHRHRPEDQPDPEAQDAPPDQTPTAYELVVSDELNNRVRAGLETLSSNESLVVNLSIFAELSPGDIVLATGFSADQVRRFKNRGLDKLRAYLERDDK